MNQQARGGLAALVFAVLFSSSAKTAGLDPDIESRVNSLLSQMTIEEKLGQLQQLDGTVEGNFKPEHLDLARKGLLGSTLNVRGAHNTNTLQKAAVEESRLKIPLLFAFDVIHGYRTVFPVPLATASSWDLSLIEKAESIAALEAAVSGLKWTFAPMVDIARDPRWGRIVEGAGEDPYLGAKIARARVHGFQGDDFSQPDKVMACAKHWVAYGAAEGGRDYNTVDMSELKLREIYFPPFKAALDAGVGTFMSAFNELNGVPSTANPFTLTQVLRGEWGFNGFVVSDYEAIKELVVHGVASDEGQAAAEAITSGVDMEMVSKTFIQNLPAIVQSGLVSESTIDEAVRRVLRVKFRLGLFEHPYVDETLEPQIVAKKEHLDFARTVAAHSIVLLKNSKNILPLNRNFKSIALIGPLANDKKNMYGSWKGDGEFHEDMAVTVFEGISSKVPQTKVKYVQGCPIEGSCDIPSAVRVAKASDAAVLVVGESADMSGEAAARSDIGLPGKQLDLVRAIQATGKPVVVVLMNGRPLSVQWIADNSTTVLEAWYLGVEAGNALADVIFGDVNPSAKLTVSVPRTVGQIPIYYNHTNTGRPASPSKYSSKYLEIPSTPLFPFGFGLSYTTFEISNLSMSAPIAQIGQQVQVSADVQNTGSRAGEEVVQLYIHNLVATVTRPIRELKGFQKILLQPGEKKRVDFILNPEDFAYYHADLKFHQDPGKFTVIVGNSSDNGIEQTIEIQR